MDPGKIREDKELNNAIIAGANSISIASIIAKNKPNYAWPAIILYEALIFAIIHNASLDVCKCIINCGAKIDDISFLNIGRCTSALTTAITANNMELTLFLVQNNMLRTYRDRTSQTSMSYAVRGDRLDIIQLLLQYNDTLIIYNDNAFDGIIDIATYALKYNRASALNIILQSKPDLFNACGNSDFYIEHAIKNNWHECLQVLNKIRLPQQLSSLAECLIYNGENKRRRFDIVLHKTYFNIVARDILVYLSQWIILIKNKFVFKF